MWSHGVSHKSFARLIYCTKCCRGVFLAQGVVAWRKRVRRSKLARQAGATAGSAGAGPWFQHSCCSSVGHFSRTSAEKDAEPRTLLQGICSVPCCLEYLSISSLAWAAARASAGVLPKGLCSSIGLLPVLILPPVPHRQPWSLFSLFPRLIHCSRLVTRTTELWWHSRHWLSQITI